MSINRVVIGLALLGCFVAAVDVSWQNSREENSRKAGTPSCDEHLRVLAAALRLYVKDYDETFPATRSSLEMPDLLWPYFHIPACWQKWPHHGGEFSSPLPVWDMSYFSCPANRGVEEGPNLSSYGWNYKLAGKRLVELRLTDSVPVFFDRRPWHRGLRWAVSFSGRTFQTRAAVPLLWSEREARRFAKPGYAVNFEILQRLRAHRWIEAERLYHRAIEQAGDNPTVGPELYEECIAVECRLGRLSDAEATWSELARKFPRSRMVAPAKKMITDASQGIRPNPQQFVGRITLLYRW